MGFIDKKLLLEAGKHEELMQNELFLEANGGISFPHEFCGQFYLIFNVIPKKGEVPIAVNGDRVYDKFVEFIHSKGIQESICKERSYGKKMKRILPPTNITKTYFFRTSHHWNISSVKNDIGAIEKAGIPKIPGKRIMVMLIGPNHILGTL